ncbi:MAG TPA: polyprenyl synthetase family protein, partial [Polyangiaceae bacterium]|nr:polyprenyl synthetase family protein [Polyangiaceae bacterium]
RYLYDPVADYPLRGGRMLRPTLVIATARAFGADLDSALNTAVALELLHNAFLVHDDVEDEGLERRGRPSLNVLHGTPVAVNVGDALSILSLRPLLENRYRLGPRVAMRILEEAERMVRESIEGQAIELGWRSDNTLGLQDADYLRMVLKKTCAYTTIFPLRAGALIGSRDSADLDRLTRFGFFLGAAFQIQDDVLNLVGDHARYGKELDGDIWEGKRTLMMIRLLQCASASEVSRLAEALGEPRARRSAEQVSWIRERMDAYGCIEYAQHFAHGLAGAANHELSVAFAGLPESRDKRFVSELSRWMLSRT